MTTTPDTPLVVGVDIGGTKCAVAVGDGGTETMLAQTRWPSDVEKGSQHMIRRITDEVKRLTSTIPGKVVGIGVGCAGPLDRHTGIVLSPPNLPGWDRVSLTARLAAILSAPAWLENDANVGALGESRFGAGRGAASLAYVTLSTGIGAGLVLNGHLHFGAGDAAGEIGHQTILPGGPKCACGNTGCLEAVASGSALAKRAQAAVAADPAAGKRLLDAAGQDGLPVSARHVAEMARAGDLLAQKLWQETIGYLAIGLGNLVTMLAPHRIILGGGLTQAGDILFDPLRDGIRQRVRLVPAGHVEIVAAGLGQDSVLRGALALAVQSLHDKRPMSPINRTRRPTTGDLRKQRPRD